MSDLRAELVALAEQARNAYRALSNSSTDQRNQALLYAARAIRSREEAILLANRTDMEAATAKGLEAAMLDRLLLNPERIEAMAAGIEQVAKLPDPLHRVLEAWDVAHNGLHIEKISVPLGVIAIIYESRPNVTADAAALCIKSGNAAILRGGSESFHSNTVIAAAMLQGLREAGLNEHAVQLIPTTDREAVGILLTLNEHIDIIIPRGGKSLTERVVRESRVPTIQHLIGNCHSYLHTAADTDVAVRVITNAKLRRTGICGATESILIDRNVLQSHGAAVIRALLEGGCAVRGDAEVRKLDPRITAANEADWAAEYLAPIVSVKTVADLAEAIGHINRYGSHHTDAILTTDQHAAQQFTREVDSAIVLVNASTQFADGGEFGFGGEIGISTGRLHARGPVGAAQLVTYKYVVTTSKAGAVRA